MLLAANRPFWAYGFPMGKQAAGQLCLGLRRCRVPRGRV